METFKQTPKPISNVVIRGWFQSPCGG